MYLLYQYQFVILHKLTAPEEIPNVSLVPGTNEVTVEWGDGSFDPCRSQISVRTFTSSSQITRLQVHKMLLNIWIWIYSLRFKKKYLCRYTYIGIFSIDKISLSYLTPIQICYSDPIEADTTCDSIDNNGKLNGVYTVTGLSSCREYVFTVQGISSGGLQGSLYRNSTKTLDACALHFQWTRTSNIAINNLLTATILSIY